MDEIFPVLAGVVVGLAVSQTSSPKLRALTVAVSGPILGAAASWVSGELLISWVYMLIDTLQVTVASIMTIALVVAWRSRARWITR